MKDVLITSGYPRSGNRYLNQALNLLYYPEDKVNEVVHTISSIDKAKKIIVPFRRPLDCIASWQVYPISSTLESDILFYTRFHKAVINNFDKIILMDFDNFTKDISYIKNKILNNFGIDTSVEITDDNIKNAMIVDGKAISLPRDNKNELDLIKEKLQKMPEFNECLSLYNAIKQHHDYGL